MRTNGIERTANIINGDHDCAEIVCPLTPVHAFSRCKIEIGLCVQCFKAKQGKGGTLVESLRLNRKDVSAHCDPIHWLLD